jgi:hypothetical protein
MSSNIFASVTIRRMAQGARQKEMAVRLKPYALRHSFMLCTIQTRQSASSRKRRKR